MAPGNDLKDAQGHNRILYNYESLGGGADVARIWGLAMGPYVPLAHFA
jgi:hypothetical protein